MLRGQAGSVTFFFFWLGRLFFLHLIIHANEPNSKTQPRDSMQWVRRMLSLSFPVLPVLGKINFILSMFI